MLLFKTDVNTELMETKLSVMADLRKAELKESGSAAVVKNSRFPMGLTLSLCKGHDEFRLRNRYRRRRNLRKGRSCRVTVVFTFPACTRERGDFIKCSTGISKTPA